MPFTAKYLSGSGTELLRTGKGRVVWPARLDWKGE